MPERPAPPPFGGLRLASADDVLRLGIVCTAGFAYAEHFQWERPYHSQHPLSTILFFRREVEDFIKSPNHIVLVADDKYDPSESSKTVAVIPDANGWMPPREGQPVAVALAIWKLEDGSKRVGQFRNDKGIFPPLGEYHHEDENQERAAKILEICEAAEKRYLHGLSTMERTVTHPAYWNPGHGSQLARWGLRLADIDGVPQGVLASSMGTALFEQIGFKKLTDVTIPGDEDDPKGFSVAVLKYKPVSSLSEVSQCIAI